MCSGETLEHNLEKFRVPNTRFQKMPITGNHGTNIKSQVVYHCALLIFFISHTQNTTSAAGRHGGHGILYKITSPNGVSTSVEVPGV